jgi:hypothetical protein
MCQVVLLWERCGLQQESTARNARTRPRTGAGGGSRGPTAAPSVP